MNTTCIIPCYNASETIARSVYSVLKQTKAVDEILIIDDGSDIPTKKVLKKLEKDIAQLSVITQENKGVSAARNFGIQKSSHPYILMLDADDIFHPEYLEKAKRAIAQNNKIAMVMCGYRMVQGRKVIDTRYPSNASFKDYLFANTGLGNGLFSKQALLDVGGYDEKMLDGYEDWDLHIRLKKHQWEFALLSEVLFDYSYMPHSRNKNALKKDSKIKLYLFLKYKEDYLVDYDALVGHFQEQIETNKNTILKREQSLNFRIGKALLSPIRWIKRKIG